MQCKDIATLNLHPSKLVRRCGLEMTWWAQISGWDTSASCVRKSPWHHFDGILYWAWGGAYSASCAVFFDDSRYCIEPIELNCLVAWVRAGNVASTAFKTAIFVNFRHLDDVIWHFFNRRYPVQLFANQISYLWDSSRCSCSWCYLNSNFKGTISCSSSSWFVAFLEIVRRILAFPAFWN